MIASMLIKEDILSLELKDTLGEAIARMNEYNVSHFPVCDEGKFIGIISEKDIINSYDNETKINKDILKIDNHCMNEHQYFYEVLKLSNDQQLSIIAVVDDADQYIGSITHNDIISYFANSMSVELPGGVIILEVSENDYSLTEIANIVESNDAKVLSSYIVSKMNSTKLEVVIKVSKINLDLIIKTFERYNYKIVASYQESTNYDELRDNYDSLINYLNI